MQNTQNEQVLTETKQNTNADEIGISQEIFDTNDIFGQSDEDDYEKLKNYQNQNQSDQNQNENQEQNDQNPITEQNYPENSEENKPLYTAEEMRNLDWEKVDTSRIPPEQMPFYKSMQAAFTKKRQAQAETLKKLAKTNGEKQHELNIQEHMAAYQKAEEIVKSQMPMEDPLSPSYHAAIQSVTNKIIDETKKSKENSIKFNDLLSEASNRYGTDFNQVDNMALNMIENELPSKVAREIVNAANNGNFVPVYALLEEAYTRLKTGPQTIQQHDNQRLNKRNIPPATLTAGGKINIRTDDTKNIFGI